MKSLVAFLMVLSLCIGFSVSVSGQTKLVNTELEFAKGELSFAQKDYRAAIEHFQHLVQKNPNNARAHYWLGASHFAAGEKENAKVEFEKVVELGQPSDLVEKANRYLSAISGKKSEPNWYQVNLATGFRYDSNLFLDSNAINLIGDQDAFSWDVYLHGAVFPVRNERFLFGMEYSFFNALYEDLEGFSFNWHRAGAILSSRFENLSVSFKPNFSATLVDHGGDLYGMLGQLPITLRYPLSEFTESEFFYRFEIEDFSDVSNETFIITNSFLRNNLSHFAGLSQYFYFMKKQAYLNLGIQFSFEDAHNPFDLWGPKIFGQAAVPLPLEFMAEIYGSFYLKYYFHDDVPDIAFTPDGIDRADHLTQVGARLRRQIFGPTWASGGYEFNHNDSNEFFADYQKHIAQFNIGVDF